MGRASPICMTADTSSNSKMARYAIVTPRTRRKETREALCDQPQIHAELSDARRQRLSVVIGVPVGERLAVQPRSAFHERHSDRCHNQHANKCHLEARCK